MRKWYKKIVAVVLAAIFVLTMPMAGITAKADAVTDAKPSDVYVSLNSDKQNKELCIDYIYGLSRYCEVCAY